MNFIRRRTFALQAASPSTRKRNAGLEIRRVTLSHGSAFLLFLHSIGKSTLKHSPVFSDRYLSTGN